MSPRTNPPHGFTLVELLVTVAILGFVSLAILGMQAGFQQNARNNNLRRQANGNVRRALTAIENDLRMAGYGIDPALAFDFNIYGGKGTACAPTPGSCGGTSTGTACNNNCLAQRDNNGTAPAGSDEIVFYYRNPGYWGADLNNPPQGRAWSFVSATSTQLTLVAHGPGPVGSGILGEQFWKGQILQVVCSGATTSAYVTVGTTNPSGAGAQAAAGNLTLTLAAASTTNPFQQDPTAISSACAGNGRVFRVDRFRYYVEPTALTLADGTPEPFLVLDQGVDRNGDGAITNADLVPIAPGITDLQFAYGRALQSPATVGADAGTSISFFSLGMNSTTTPLLSWGGAGDLGVVDFSQFVSGSTGSGCVAGSPCPQLYGFVTVQTTDPIRNSAYAPNITWVDVSVVGRTIAIAQGLQKQGSPGFDQRPIPFNQPAAFPADTQPYVYERADTVIQVQNTSSRGLTYM